MSDYVCFTLLGSRRILIDLHLQRLQNFFPGDIIALEPRDPKLTSYFSQKYPNIHFVRRSVDTFKNTNADRTYDILIKRYANAYKKFLLVHDDTIFSAPFNNCITENSMFDYFGALDNVADPLKSPYRFLKLDRRPMSELRIGTWFLSGDVNQTLHKGYSFGKKETVYPLLLNLKYRSFRINLLRYKITLNGGFDFNISSRLQNEKIKIIMPKCAHHFCRMASGFQSRSMLQYTDTDEEQALWISRLNNLRSKDIKQYKKDRKFMKGILNYFQDAGIEDGLFNDRLRRYISEDDKG